MKGFLTYYFCLDPIFIVGVSKTGASLTPELELPRINLKLLSEELEEEKFKSY